MIEVPMELLSFLRSEEGRAQDPDLDDRRAVALKFYEGQPFGDEVEGRSQVVTRDVSEVVDFMLVGILGAIMAGGKAVEFETEPEDVPVPDAQPQPGQPPQTMRVDYGAQATAAVQYQFFRKQQGYRILHDCLKAGFNEKTGIIKTFVEPQKAKRQTFDVPAEAIELGPDGHTLNGMPIVQADPLDGGWQPGMESQQWRVVVEMPQPPIVRDEAVPNEQFLMSPDTVELATSPYVGQRMAKTLSDLVAMGFDPAEVEEVWGSLPPQSIVERARDAGRSYDAQSVGTRSGAVRSVWFTEEYVLWDLDGDGIAERLCVHRIAEKVFAASPVDEQPYSLWSPFPAANRIVGQSMADKTMDIQRVRSVLLRQALDSLYISNAPRTTVSTDSMTEDTIDDLLTVRSGALIRFKGAIAPAPFVQQDTSPQAFAAMEMMSAERESRTGVTRQSQGMNPDSMNKTASGMAMLQGNSDQIELYVTRNFAEFIVAPIFARRYRLMREHVKPFRMKIDGKYTTVDPSKWPEEPDMAINVGLGTGNKQERIMYRTQLLAAQQQAMVGGLRIVTEQEVYNNLKAVIDDTSLGVATDYVLDPSTLPPAPEKPDPAMMEVQAKQQQVQAQLQLDQQKTAAQLGLSQQESAAKLDQMREEAALKLQLEREKSAAEIEQARERMIAEINLEHQRMTLEFEQNERNAQRQHELSMEQVKITANRPGGSLAE